MRIAFKQGVVSYPATGSTQTFLQKSDFYVNINTANGPTSVTFADGTSNYLHYEDANVSNAWGPFNVSDTYYLYWDINPLTGERTFGHTTIQPVTSSVRPDPNTVLDDTHWFDTTQNRMKVRINGGWRNVIRVFAASYDTSAFTPLGNDVNSPFAGTQVGLETENFSGRILFDGLGVVIRKKNRELFTTEDEFFVAGSRINSVRLEASITYATATETIPAFSVVTYDAIGDISLAEYVDVKSSVIGIASEDFTDGKVGPVVLQGTIENSNWNWSTVGDSLWVSTFGQLVTSDPYVTDITNNPTRSPSVAKVLSATSIIFDQSIGVISGEATTISSTVDPATPTTFGTVKTTTATNTVVSTDDTRMTNARTPLSHVHAASDVTFTPSGNISSSNVQSAMEELEGEKLALSGGTLTGTLSLSASPTNPNEAATKNYVVGLVSGLQWKDPIHYVNLIGDDVSDPTSLTPDRSDVYIVSGTGAGAWTGKPAGTIVVWDGSVWVDDIHGDSLLSGHDAGTRFLIAGETTSTPTGSFLNKKNQIAVLDVPATPTWSFLTPASQDAVFVDNEESLHAYHQYVYSDGDTAWIEFGGGNALEAGTNLTLIGNILNVRDWSNSGTVDAATLQGNAPSAFESAFAKNTGFNLNLGTIAGTVSEGNHSHTLDGLSNTNITSLADGHLLKWDATATNWVNADIPYDLAAQAFGAPANSALVLRFKAVRQYELGTTGHTAEADTASTGTAEFDVQKNGVSIGTVTFTTSATGVVSIAATTFAVGDVLKIIAPASADGTLSDIGFSFKGRETII